MKIYDKNGFELLDANVSDSSYRYRAIMGENALTLTFSLSDFIEIPVGSYADFQGERYTLLKPQNFKKNNTRNFDYTLILESAKSLLGRYKFKDTGSNRLKFSLTAKPQDHLKMLVDNLNQRDAGWTVGDYIESAEKVISYNHTYCDDALRMIAEAFNTEYEIVGKRISIKKVEYNKLNPLPLSYGFGNGFKSGVKRDNYSNSKAIEILYVQGGERNINPSAYGSKELLLPISQTFEYEGRSYVTDADGLSIRRYDKALSSYIEDSKDCSHIYPSRIGTVSSVVAVDAAKNFYDVIDISIPENLDYSQCRIAGEKATIIFQSGMLAGKEFDLEQTDSVLSGYVHSERRFKIVPQEIDGVTMPGGAFLPAQNDKYAVFGISLPSAYVCDNASKTGASWDMFRESVKYLYENEDPRFSFTGELDEIWAKSDWLNIGGRILLGGFISFTDAQFQNDPVLIRITGIKDFINNPYSPQIELSNVTAGGTTSSMIKDIPLTEVVIDTAKKEVIRYAKRGFRDAQQTTKMLQESLLNFAGSISPISVQTMQLIAGDESLQFEFVANSGSTATVPHLEAFNPGTKQFSSAAGVLQHKTLGITSLSSSHAASEFKWWNMAAYTSAVLSEKDKSYYVYAKVSKTANTGIFLLSETAIGIESVAGYYHLLMGILNSEFDGDRSYSAMYGYSELTPGRLTVKKIVDPTGECFVDLENKVIQGNFKFQSGVRVEDDATAKANAALSAAATDATNKVNAIKVGGRNYILNSEIKSLQGWHSYFSSLSIVDNSLRIAGNSQYVGVRTIYAQVMDAQKEVTISFYAKNNRSSNIGIKLFPNGANEVFVDTLPANSDWVKLKKTFVPAQYQPDQVNASHIYIYSTGEVDFQIKKVQLEYGNKPFDWKPAIEDVAADIAAAQNAANNAQTTANASNTAVSNLNTYVDNSFKDGVIETSEAKAIEKYKNIINDSKTSAESEYNNLYTNSYLEGTAKSNLLNAKISLFGAIDNLLSSINTAIADGKTTIAEKADVDSKYSTYITSIGSYKAAVESAAKSIQVKLDGLSTTKANAAQSAAATDAANKINAIQIGGRNLIPNSDINFPPALHGPVRLIDESLSSPLVIGHTYIFSAKRLVKNGYTELVLVDANNVWHHLAVNVPFIADREYNRFFFYTNRTGEVAIEKPKLELGNIATDWTPALEDFEAYALAKANLAEITAKAYADGIVTAEEQRSIADATSKANAAQATAISAAATDATNKVNAIQVGVRNLLKNSKQTLSGVGMFLIIPISEPLEPGQTYTASMRGIRGEGASFALWGSAGYERLVGFDIPLTGPQTFSKTFVYGGAAGNHSSIYVYSENSPNPSTFHWAMIVKGNKAPADWTPSPEDIDAKYLKEALQGSTEIQGGLVNTNVMQMKNAAGTTTAGMSGLANDGIDLWTAGTYAQALAGIAKNIFFSNGSLRLADGAILYDVIQNALTISALIRTAGNGARVEVSKESNSITIFDANNVARMKLAPKNVMSFADIGGTSDVVTLTYPAHSGSVSGTGTTNIGSTELLVLNTSKYYDIVTPAVGVNLYAVGYRDGVTKENFVGSASVEVRLVDTIHNTIVWSQASSVSSGTTTPDVDTGTIAPKTLIGLAGSTYRLDVILTTSYDGNGSDATAYASISAGQTLKGTTMVSFSEMGFDGFNFINDIAHFLHYGPDIFAYKGAMNFPGVLATGSVAANNAHYNKWGHKVATDAQPITRGGTGVYNVPHNLGSDLFTVNVTPAQDNINCRITGRSNNSFQITCRNMSGTLIDSGFDYTMLGSN